MNQYITSLKDCLLFKGIDEENIIKMLNCLSASKKNIFKDEFVFHVGDRVKNVYIILEGSVHILDEDFWGNRSIIETMHHNTLFGEAYVFSTKENQLVSVIAAEDSVVLEIDPMRLFKVCPNECSCHTQLIKNTLFILSEKIVQLTEKLGHIIQRTIREKLLSYLSKCAKRTGNSSFYIPYTRQQLSDYLCVDRSALSHELSKLQKIGVLRYRKNYFELLEDPHEI